jgi:hypothetical protein
VPDYGSGSPKPVLEKQVSTFKEHCDECEAKLGNAWYVVHRWLDEYARKGYPKEVHRKFRHHREGIEEVRKMWGDEAARAAELHITKDCGYVPDRKEWDVYDQPHDDGKEFTGP